MTRSVDWIAAEASYRTALAELRAYDAEKLAPYIDDTLPIGPERNSQVMTVPAAVFEHSGALSTRLLEAEKVLMALPSPDAAAFALKVTILHGDEATPDSWEGMLVSEARMFGA